ncbi:MAG: hypothetical protein IJ488_04030 [Clostridia bacterium]|nr:hypothetical protein [Clostridia bacterium]
MKRIISTVLVCLLLIGSVFALASCGNNPSGTYESTGYISVAKTGGVYEFSGKKVTYTYYIGGVESYSVEGEFKVAENDEGELEITLTYGEEKEDAESGTVAFEKGDDYIKIAGIKYTKAEK